MKRGVFLVALTAGALTLTGCSLFQSSGQAQADRNAMLQADADRMPAPDDSGVYLDLITRMQAKGLYYASLAHIDAYEKQYGVKPQTIMLRGDALRETGQLDASAVEYNKLIKTSLAAEGHHGLGLLAGAAGDFAQADTQLTEAVALEPTNALMLSDLAYARLRSGNVVSARVPLLKAAELDQKSQKIMSNLALYMLVIGRGQQAKAFMTQQNFSPDVRQAILDDAGRVNAARNVSRDAANRWASRGGGMTTGAPTQMGATAQSNTSTTASVPINTIDAQTVLDLPAPMLERFAPGTH